MADIGYTYGYYADLNPLATQMAFLTAGLAPPRVATACELGFGQGVSLNMHAAASSIQWWGTDFNPSQAAFAHELSRASGANANLFDQSFAEFCARTDLPQMDYIGLHGIWSWISDANRSLIVDFVRRKLNVGGVLYISYNSQPGWAAMVPIRDLFVEHAAVMGSPGQGVVSRVDAALVFTDKLLAVNPAFARANPAIAERLKKLASHSRNYLAHEYFNRDWEPMSFAKMAQWLGQAKLSFACSAQPLDQVDAVNLTPEQQALLKDIPDPVFRQTVRDFCINQQFRKDFWVKGPRPLSGLQQLEALRKQRFALAAPAKDVTLKVASPLGEMNLNESIYQPIIDALADHQPKSLAEIEKAARAKDTTFAQLLQAVLLLNSKAAVLAAQDAPQAALAKPRTDALNRHLMEAARSGKDVQCLASPLFGGGYAVSRFQQLFLAALAQGKKSPEEWAKDVWQTLSTHGERLLKDGKPLESAEENLAVLTEQAREMAEKHLALYKAAQII